MTTAVVWVPARGQSLALNGFGYPPQESGGAPDESLLKVWTGTEWVGTGVSVKP